MEQAIFKSITVIELASVLAGPAVGQFLAELGAKVIKVENPATDGDVTRSWKTSNEPATDSVSAYFSSVNAGKQSIALDLNTKKGKDELYRLLQQADVVISSYKPGDAEKLGLSYQEVKKMNPAIIYAELTGYGPDDPKVGYDAVLQAETGFMFLNGEKDGASIKMPVALIDILAAHQLKEAILLAYIHRLKSDEGSKVSVSLFDAAVSSLANQATNYLIGKKSPAKMGAEHPNIVPYGRLFQCADAQQIILAVGTDKQFKHLCKILGMADLAAQTAYKTNSARVANRASLNKLLQEKISNFETDNLLNKCKSLKVPAGKLNTVEMLFEQPEAQQIVLYKDDKPVGLRNFIAKMSFISDMPHLTPPPGYSVS